MGMARWRTRVPPRLRPALRQWRTREGSGQWRRTQLVVQVGRPVQACRKGVGKRKPVQSGRGDGRRQGRIFQLALSGGLVIVVGTGRKFIGRCDSGTKEICRSVPGTGSRRLTDLFADMSAPLRCCGKRYLQLLAQLFTQLWLSRGCQQLQRDQQSQQQEQQSAHQTHREGKSKNKVHRPAASAPRSPGSCQHERMRIIRKIAAPPCQPVPPRKPSHTASYPQKL